MRDDTEKPVEFKRTHSYPCSEYRTAQVWKSLLQTPYNSSLALSSIKTVIEENDLWEQGILEELSCPRMNESSINGYYQKFTDQDGVEVNGLFRWNYIANFKSGFWEMELYTTQCLQVPEYRRPRI